MAGPPALFGFPVVDVSSLMSFFCLCQKSAVSPFAASSSSILSWQSAPVMSRNLHSAELATCAVGESLVDGCGRYVHGVVLVGDLSVELQLFVPVPGQGQRV